VRDYTLAELQRWCSVPLDDLEGHPERKVPLRLCRDSAEMGRLMALELIEEVVRNDRDGRETRAIVPCGPMAWYEPFGEIVRERRVSLRRLVVFHMDECLDWQGRPLPSGHPMNFRSVMERVFYAPIPAELAVPEVNRVWLMPSTIDEMAERLAEAPIDLTLGGLGQDGHVAFNQARRDPYGQLSIDDLRASTVRIQDNNADTVIALAQRTFGGAYQFVAPMSVTLGVRECLSARRVRLFTDTGAWKQTALRVVLFGPLTPEYPATFLQEHPDAQITATMETARHPIAEHPEWQLLADTADGES
jgi:glucosamine-6-phosphate deaminase